MHGYLREASGQAQCLKIKEKVLFNIASEASSTFTFYVAKSSLNTPKNWRVFENLIIAVKQCYQTGQFKWTKIGKKCYNGESKL